jgi:serine/threonine protein kinase
VSTPSGPRSSTAPQDVPQSGLVKGTVIKDTWRIIDFLGEGGAGAVYIAEHCTLGHPVAIKTLFEKYLRDSDMRRRFQEEAIIQANLNHPNIARVTDVIDDGRFCAIIMEYIAGSSLDRALTAMRRPMSIDKACQIMLALLDGIGHAHGQGVVHRDIKPANILLASSGDGVVPKVTDFGIAKILTDHKRTETGTAMGTVYYASPEQLTDAKSVDHRADIYSLGCTFYELLTGKLPFEDGSLFGVMKKHVQAARPDPSIARADVPPAIARVVVRAMAIERDQRPQTCSEFRDDLKRAMAASGTRVSNGPISLPSAPPSASRNAVAEAPQARASARPATSGERPVTDGRGVDGSSGGGPRSPSRQPALGSEDQLSLRSTPRFTGPLTGSRTLPSRPAKPARNVVSIAIWILSGVLFVGIIAFVVIYRSPDVPKDDLELVTRPEEPTVIQREPVAAEPALEEDVVEDAPPAVAALLTLAGCRTAVGEHLSLSREDADRVNIDAVLAALERRNEQCPELMRDAAGDSGFDQITADLDTDVLRFEQRRAQAIHSGLKGENQCGAARAAATAASNALGRISMAQADRRLYTIDVNSIESRRSDFVLMHDLVSSDHPDCQVVPLTSSLRGAELAPQPEPERYDHAVELRQRQAERLERERIASESLLIEATTND